MYLSFVRLNRGENYLIISRTKKKTNRKARRTFLTKKHINHIAFYMSPFNFFAPNKGKI